MRKSEAPELAPAEKIRQENGVLSGPVCPACGEAASAEAREKCGRFALFACARCDLHFWNPREMPDGHWYEQMYGHRDAQLLDLEP